MLISTNSITIADSSNKFSHLSGLWKLPCLNGNWSVIQKENETAIVNEAHKFSDATHLGLGKLVCRTGKIAISDGQLSWMYGPLQLFLKIWPVSRLSLVLRMKASSFSVLGFFDVKSNSFTKFELYANET